MRSAAHELFAHQVDRFVLTGRHPASAFAHRHIEQIHILRMRHAELERSAADSATADRFAGFFPQRNFERSAGWPAEIERVIRGLFVVSPAQLAGKPSGQEHGRGTKTRSEIDLDAFDFLEARVGGWVVEELVQNASRI